MERPASLPAVFAAGTQACRHAETPDVPPSSLMQADTQPPPEVKPPRANILLVDDEARNLDVLDSLLDSPEYNLVRALTAERALMLLLEGDFAAIVLDIQMPGMSGIELANLIKQRRRTQHIPIIFLTAYFQEDKDVLQGYGSGAVDYLTKPINPQILRSKIAVFVDLYRKTAALAASNRALELEVTQRLQAEDALRRVNNELEERVEARTAELLRVNQELSEREKALRESDTRLQRELVQCKVIEAALRASEAQLRLVTDDAPVFITQMDREHRFKFVNRTYARRFGFEPEDLIGKHFTEVMGETPYVAIRHQIEAALDGNRVEFEAEIPYASLGPRWVFVIHEPERSPTGEVVGLVAVITD
ncbi:MAG TPA: response regulator, partial [Opitutus sp.]|nr:response regulator [Opitutus sp.]